MSQLADLDGDEWRCERELSLRIIEFRHENTMSAALREALALLIEATGGDEGCLQLFETSIGRELLALSRTTMRHDRTFKSPWRILVSNAGDS